jgi:hypothetical protein
MDMLRILKEGQPPKSRVINYHKSAMTPAFEKLEENSLTKVLKNFSSSKIQLHQIGYAADNPVKVEAGIEN